MNSPRTRSARPRHAAGPKYLALAFAIALCVVATNPSRVGRSQGSAQNVVWVNCVNTVATGNSLQKTAGQWDAGANSQQQINAAGGYVEFGVSAGHRMMVGLSNDTSAAVDYTQLAYAFNFWGATGDFDIREGWGNNRAGGTYAAGDVFRIAVESGVVKYYKNGAVVYTSGVAPSYPLVLDTALTAMGATVQDAVVLAQTGSIRTDRAVYPEPPLFTPPAAGGKYTDPTFGTQVLRVTDANDGPAPGLGTFYSIWPTFNADDTKLLVRSGVTGGAIIKQFHPDTFTVDSGRINLPSNFGDGLGDGPSWQFAIWSNTDPNIIYAVSNGPQARLMSYNVLAGGSASGWTQLKSFQAQMDGGILFHMTMSEDEDVFAFYQINGGANSHFLVWRRSTDTLLRVPTSGPNSILPPGYTLNEVDVDKTGKYLVIAVNLPNGVSYQQCTTGFAGTESGKVLNLETLEYDTYHWCDTDDPPGHGGLGRGTNVGQALFDYGLNKRLLGDIHRFSKMFAPRDAEDRLDLTENFHGTMLGDNEGWITIGTYDDDYDQSLTDYGVFEDEIYQVALDGSQRFRRLVHTRTNWVHKDLPGFNEPLNGYWAIAKPTISHDGRYIAYTSNWEESLGRYDMFIVQVPPAPQPDIVGRMFRSFGPVDLTAEGGLDWAQWGHSTASPFNRKAGVNLISNYETVGTATPARYADNRFSYRWTDGAPTAGVADTYTGVAVAGLNNGFRISVPADTTARTLRVYVGASQARGRIEATLSGNNPAYFDVSVDANNSVGTLNGVYSINYRAQTAGQTLTVTYTLNRDYAGGAGKVSLQAATLSLACTPPTSPSLVVSEFRLRGPKGPKDEFVELYNKTDAPLTVCAADGSAGWALAARTANGTPDATVFTIPNGTMIPPRGYYLAVNRGPNGYSLASHPAGGGRAAVGDLDYVTDIGDNVGFALFKTSNPANFTLANRLDAVGSAAETNTLYREGAGYPSLTVGAGAPADYSFYRDNCGKGGSTSNFGPCPISTPKDSGDNAADFIFVSTDGGNYGAGQRLGAPGPENLSSPVQRNASFGSNLLDPCVSSSVGPNRVRDFTADHTNNSAFGTLDIRRSYTNNTGAPVTRLRFRVTDLSTFPAPSGVADLRPRSSGDIVTTVDRAPCGSGTSSVTVRGTTVEQPPAQPNGGGFNTTMSAGTITLASPLADGATVDVRFLLGIQQTGSFKFIINVEAMP